MFESFEKTKPTGDLEEELLDIPRFLRRQDPDLDFSDTGAKYDRRIISYPGIN